MHVYIHAGTPKTGTTAIQSLFCTNRKILKRRFNICYPTKGRIRRGHHNIAYYYGGPHLRSKFMSSAGTLAQALAEASAACANACVISSEAFYQLNINSLWKLKSDLAGVDTTIILYLRRQDSYLQSGYQQLLKLGYVTESPIEFCERKASRGYYDKHVAKFQRVFGEANILVRRFEQRETGFDVRHDFCTLLGVDAASLVQRQSPESLNLALGIKGLTFLRSLVLSSQVTKPEKPSKEFFGRILNYFRGPGRDRYDFSLLSYQQALSLYDKYRDSNRRLAQLVSPQGEPEFFSSRPSESEYPGIPGDLRLSLRDKIYLRIVCARHGLSYPPHDTPSKVFSLS
jgi:hypothetical protein